MQICKLRQITNTNAISDTEYWCHSPKLLIVSWDGISIIRYDEMSSHHEIIYFLRIRKFSLQMKYQLAQLHTSYLKSTSFCKRYIIFWLYYDTSIIYFAHYACNIDAERLIQFAWIEDSLYFGSKLLMIWKAVALYLMESWGLIVMWQM